MKPDLGREQDGQNFSVVAGYEDFDSGLRAVNLYQRVLWEHSGGDDHVFKLWKFEPLGITSLLDQAVREATTADLIVISIRGDHPLPSEARVWLEKIRTLRRNEGAISLLVAAEFQNHPAAMGSHEYLEKLAIDSGLEFFSSVSRRIPEELSQLRPSLYVTNPVINAVTRCAERIERWGINE